ncbi:penicillin acylase family protein [Thalassotalea agarivorans]|uniref:Acyl-homoserine-lactone acylase n=1 Tax=Thalassotalea agarivorans TaxID=349064 RepID=A0A1I0DHK0_THASX|nr:penicillin acylase family protein [Thalassotalea agarivorans]SET31506.1 acyl-homoserine-lactone acylase [Thalassotalea agarivorans]
MRTKKLLPLFVALGLVGCDGADAPEPKFFEQPQLPVITDTGLKAFDPDGVLSADIKYTSYGVPHITADNLQSLGFGSGYAYAKENACILLDQMVKVHSERSKYFGPDKVLGSGDNGNLISDFGHLAMRVMEDAESLYPSLSDNTKALLEGYSVGFNQYMTEVGTDGLAPECAGQPWVAPIDPVSMLAYVFSTSQMASSLEFLSLAFLANPGNGGEYLPYVGTRGKSANVSSAEANDINLNFTNTYKEMNEFKVDLGHLGSNGWGVGKEATANGKGIVLANPHFPFTGHLRFFQTHLTIPGQLDVAGAGLQGLPGIVNIGFNQHLAWTHTVSTSRRFVVYQLLLDSENPMQYIVDDEKRDIEKRTYYVEVNAGSTSIVLGKDFFYSHHGLMIETPASMNFLDWTESKAYTLRDSAEKNLDLIDHWLAMNMATNLEEFQQAFKDYDGIPWTNTMYADDQGNAFYIDKTRVLNLSDAAMQAMRTDPVLVGTRQLAGFDILPGHLSLFEPDGLNSYEQAPKLLRDDYVQNSNNSYWTTNANELLTGYSLLYGDDVAPITYRSRMGLTLVEELVNAKDVTPEQVEAALLSNRAYLGEAVLADLLTQCQAQGSTPVVIKDSNNLDVSVDISAGCAALGQWDGLMNKDSIGGHVFREFSMQFNANVHFTTPFDPTDPINTPNNLATDGSALMALAAAIKTIESAGLPLDATMGDVQFTEKTLPNGTAQGVKFPWAGAKNQEGGFNVFADARLDDTLYPIHQYPAAIDITRGAPARSGLTTEGYHINYGSSWMFVVGFTDEGPKARGILSYSQSADTSSVHNTDQNQLYSDTSGFRPLLFTAEEIEADLQQEITVVSQ